MRILYCEGNIDGTIGGSYFSLLYMVQGLDRSKYEPIVVFQTDNNLISRFEECGIHTMIVSMPRPYNLKAPDAERPYIYRLFYGMTRPFQKFLNFMIFLPLRSLRLARIIRQSNIDLIHLNNSVIRNNDWMLAAFLTRTKCVTHERGINHSYPRISKFFAKRLDAIICISDAVKQSLRSGGVACSRIVTIYNGIDTSVMKPTLSYRDIREKHSIAPDKTLICVIGNIKKWKGQDTIVRAMPFILEKHPDTVCLLVGDNSSSDYEYADLLQNLIQDLDLAKAVVICGRTSNVSDYIHASTLLVHTSTEPEPFGRVLIEAMSLSRPVVASDAGAVPEIVKHGETGFLFEPGNHLEIAKMINLVLDNPEFSQQMGRNGFLRVTSAFNIQTNSKKLTALYSGLFDETN